MFLGFNEPGAIRAPIESSKLRETRRFSLRASIYDSNQPRRGDSLFTTCDCKTRERARNAREDMQSTKLSFDEIRSLPSSLSHLDR